MSDKIVPAFYLVAGETIIDKEGHMPVPELAKWINITEDEYRSFIIQLKKKGALDENGDRIDGQAQETYDPFVDYKD